MSGDVWCLVGSGGHALAVADVLRRLGGSVGCVADPEGRWPAPSVHTVRDEESALEWARSHDAPMAVGVGDNSARLRIVRAAQARGVRLPAVVAATATASPDAELGPGVVVMEHAHVGPFATVDAAALVNTAAVVEHDCRVGAGTHVAPGAVLLGHVEVGARCLVGARSTVLVGRRVGDDAVLGAGTVVVVDLPGATTYVGCPATEVSQPGPKPPSPSRPGPSGPPAAG